MSSKAERLANSPSKIEGVAAELATQTGAYDTNLTVTGAYDYFAETVICANCYIVAKPKEPE